MTAPDDDEDRPPAPTGPTPAEAGYRLMPPGPPPRGERYATAWVWLGALLGIAVPIGGVLLEVRTDLDASGGLLQLLCVSPFVVGGILFAFRGDPRRAGLALGMLIGWGALLVVGAGVCVTLIAQYSSSGMG